MNRSSIANNASLSEILVPDDLSELNRWVLRRYEDRSGRVTKVPYQAGRARASSRDPRTWDSRVRRLTGETMMMSATVFWVPAPKRWILDPGI
jgi:hypothetical protein